MRNNLGKVLLWLTFAVPIWGVIGLCLWAVRGEWTVMGYWFLWMLGVLSILLQGFLAVWLVRFTLSVKFRDLSPNGAIMERYGKVTVISPTMGDSTRNLDRTSGLAQIAPPQVVMPTMAEVLSSGELMSTGGIVMGYDERFSPVSVPVDSNRMLRVGGETQSGKSNTLAFLLLQHLLRGNLAAVCDPHYSKQRSVSSLLKPMWDELTIATTPDGIESVVNAFHSELQRRIEGSNCPPFVLVFDEWTKYAKTALGHILALDIESIAQEGSGYNMYVILGGQLWSSKRVGGTELRRSFVASLVHRLDDGESRFILSNVPKWSKVTPTLDTGQVIYHTGRDFQRLRVPHVVESDVETVKGLLKGKNNG